MAAKENEMTLVAMPMLGLHQLADQCWPGDANDDEAHEAHVAYLLALNSDTLTNDTSHQVGVPVRVPAAVAPRVVVEDSAPPEVPPDSVPTPDDTPTDKRNKLDSNSNNNSRHGG
jgi:hypothetical protein